MSVVDKEKVDGIALSRDEKSIRLLISDHLDWDDEYNHLLLLQDKINAYLSFCEMNQYEQIYPNEVVEYAVLEIHFLYNPTKNAIKFLEQVQKQVVEMGITIECHISEDNRNED